MSAEGRAQKINTIQNKLFENNPVGQYSSDLKKYC
jgi:hypothetical protein